MCVCICGDVPQYLHDDQRTRNKGSWFSTFSIWVLGIKLGSSGLATSTFSHWAISPALNIFLSKYTLIVCVFQVTYLLHKRHIYWHQVASRPLCYSLMTHTLQWFIVHLWYWFFLFPSINLARNGPILLITRQFFKKLFLA